MATQSGIGIRGRFIAILGVLLLSFIVLQSTASAQQAYSITGTYKQYCCNWPNNPTKAANFPNPINSFPFAANGGGLSIQAGQPAPSWFVVGSPGGTLKFPANAVNMDASFLNTAPGFPGWVSIFTNIGVVNEAGTMVPDGRTGTKAYCLTDAGNPNCTDPANGAYTFGVGTTASVAPLNGLMSFSEKGGGDGRFGGTMRMIGGTPGYVLRTAGAGTGTHRSGQFKAAMTQIGGPFSEYKPEVNTVVFTKAGATTKTELDPIVFAGIPWGTGNVYAVMSQNSGYFATQSFDGAGYDNRTAGGLGNIQLVAASFVRGPTTGGFPTIQEMTLAVPEPGQIAMLASGLGLLGVFGLRSRRARKG